MAVDSNYVAFGEKAVLMVVDLYGMTASEPCVIKGEILRQIIEVSENKAGETCLFLLFFHHTR